MFARLQKIKVAEKMQAVLPKDPTRPDPATWKENSIYFLTDAAKLLYQVVKNNPVRFMLGLLLLSTFFISRGLSRVEYMLSQ